MESKEEFINSQVTEVVLEGTKSIKITNNGSYSNKELDNSTNDAISFVSTPSFRLQGDTRVTKVATIEESILLNGALSLIDQLSHEEEGSRRNSQEESEGTPLSWYSEPGASSYSRLLIPTSGLNVEEKENKTCSATKDKPKSIKLPSKKNRVNLKMEKEETECVSYLNSLQAQLCKSEPRRMSRKKNISLRVDESIEIRSRSVGPQMSANKPLLPPNSSKGNSSKFRKGILKSDSSGSEKQSSMDSLGTLSESTPPLTNGIYSVNGRYTRGVDERGRCSRIDKYATLRPKSSVRPSVLLRSYPSASSIPELMAKSMSYIENSSTSRSIPKDRAKKTVVEKRITSPCWEPSPTRTSVLRLQKMKESKAKGSSSVNSETLGPVKNGLLSQGHSSESKGGKVFGKLSSGQTSNSLQKRIRQEKGSQREGDIFKTPIFSPSTSTSPHPFEYGEGRDKYKGAVERLEEVEKESQEVINFLQDEKKILADSLTEAETEIKRLRDKLERVERESESKCLIRMDEEYKKGTLESNANLKKLESVLQNGGEGLDGLRTQLETMIRTLTKKYNVSSTLISYFMEGSIEESENGEKIENSREEREKYLRLKDKSKLHGSLLLPLVTILSSSFDFTILKTFQNGNSTTGKNGHSHKSDSSLITKITELQFCFKKFITLIRIIVLQCDVHVSNVTTNILEVLNSSGDDKNQSSEFAQNKSSSQVEPQTVSDDLPQIICLTTNF